MTTYSQRAPFYNAISSTIECLSILFAITLINSRAKARLETMTEDQRKESARKAAQARWDRRKKPRE